MSEKVENTDVELWREPGASPGMDYYQPSIHVTKDNGIGIDVGGNVIVMPLRDWHKLAKEATQPSEADEVQAKASLPSKLAPKDRCRTQHASLEVINGIRKPCPECGA